MGRRVMFRMLSQHREEWEHGQIGPTTLSNPTPTPPPAIGKHLVLLCPGYDPLNSPFRLTGAQERAQPAQRTQPCSLCHFSFSSPCCLFSQTRTQVSVQTALGLPTPQAGSGMEKRGLSVGVPPGFQCFRSGLDPFEDFPKEIYSWVLR